jgi:predicted permease
MPGKRIIEFFRRRRLDRELDDEVAFHLSQLEAGFRRQGMDDTAAAAAARREFGGVAHAKESYREERGLPWLENLARDLRYAARLLRLNPGFTAAAVLSLALGIGASTAIFSLFHTLMLRMLPVRHPEELVSLYRTGAWGHGIASYPFYLQLSKRTDLFEGVFASTTAEKTAIGGIGVESARREFVTGNYFSELGVRPVLGRVFSDDDNHSPHGHPIVVLSYDVWRTRFGGDPSIVGRRLTLDDEAVTVAGVAAPGFRGVGLDEPADLWEPVMMVKGNLQQPGLNLLWIAARKRPGLPLPKLQAGVNVVHQQFLNDAYGSHPNAAFRKAAMSQRVQVREGGLGISLLRDRFGKPLTILMAAVLLVLLAACVNVANLMLARGAARRKEIALRVSLGATRARLVRQSLTESLLLAAAGAAAGILLAFWGIRGLLQFLPESSGNPFQRTPDMAVLAFCMAAALISVALFGLVPAFRTTAIDPADGLRAADARVRTGPPLFRRTLVVAQVAFSVVLAVLAALFGESLGALRSIDLGFRNQDVIAFSVDLPGAWKPEARKAARLRVMSDIEALPGVSAASFGFPGPYLQGTASATVRVPGSPLTASEPAWVSICYVSPGFFAMLGSPPVAGREFDRTDKLQSGSAVIVNEAFVRRFLPDEKQPLLRTVNFDSEKPAARIVGVVRDILHKGVLGKSEPVFYLPAEMDTTWGTILVASSLPRQTLTAAVHREAAGLGPQASVGDPHAIRQEVDDSIFEERMLSTLSGCFGALTLLLAAVGLYGVVAYGTAQRTGEIGIRIALGASRGAVVWMVLRGALLLVLAGLALGLPAALAAGRYVASVLIGVTPGDLSAFAATTAVLLFIGIAAAFLPARRSAAMDPMRALRHE